MIGRFPGMLGCLATAMIVMAAETLAGEGYLRLEGHGGPVKGVAISPDGKYALTASFDYSVGFWDLEDGRLLRWLEGHEAAANDAIFVPGDRALSVGDDFDLILWDLKTGNILRRMQGHKGKLLSVTLSPDGTLAATSGWDGRVGLWSFDSDDPPRWLDGHRANVNAAVFSTDGSKLYTASYDGTIRRWDVASLREEARLVNHGFGVNQLVLNEKDGWLAYGAVDGAVRAISLATGDEIADLTADRRPILALDADRDKRFLAVGDGEGFITIIDTSSWVIVRDFRAALSGPIWALAWEPDGGRLLTGGLSEDAVLWPIGGDAVLFTAARESFQKPPHEMSNGERQFVRKCSICHSLSPDGGRKAGPSLWGVFGRRAGTLPGYHYSDALLSADIVWSDATIARLFDEGPERVTPGSKMPMQKINGAVDRDDLIAYLKENTGPARARGNDSQGEQQ